MCITLCNVSEKSAVPSAIQVLPLIAEVVSPNSATFICESSGNIIWRKFGSARTLVSDIDDVNITSQAINSTTTRVVLQVLNTQPSDTGSYECIATKAGVKSSTSAQLIVNGTNYIYSNTVMRCACIDTRVISSFIVAPVIIAPPADAVILANETDSVSVECSATGIPPPTISFFDATFTTPLDSSLDSRIYLSNQTEPILYKREDGEFVQQVNRYLILSYAQDKNSGGFYCVAEVPGVGTTRQQAFLLIQSI